MPKSEHPTVPFCGTNGQLAELQAEVGSLRTAVIELQDAVKVLGNKLDRMQTDMQLLFNEVRVQGRVLANLMNQYQTRPLGKMSLKEP